MFHKFNLNYCVRVFVDFITLFLSKLKFVIIDFIGAKYSISTTQHDDP